MTSFSILMARYKGDLAEFVAGAKAIDALKTGSRVLVSEGCTHHAQADDIGRVQIPAGCGKWWAGNWSSDSVPARIFLRTSPATIL